MSTAESRYTYTMVERKRVVIVGAGASGIAAATRLYENGIDDIIVLEAENRIGGRVNTVEIENRIIELGAQWIHGEKDNVVYELASARKLTSDLTPPLSAPIVIRSSGEFIEPELAKRILKMFGELVKNPKTDAKSFPNTGAFYLHMLESEFNKSENSDISEAMKSEIIEFSHKCLNSYDASDSWFTTSVSMFDELKLCEGNFKLSWKGTGYRALFDILMEKSRKLTNGSFDSDVIALNNEVEWISVNDHHSESGRVKIRCSSGRKISADHVIITMSIGALREVQETLFDNMLLPELKIRSIKNIEMGTVDKIYLEFSKQWWPNDCLGFELLWTKSDREEYAQKGLGWVTDIFGISTVELAPNVLCAWISGESARIMESLSEKFVHDTIVEMLRKIFSKTKKLEVADAIRIMRSTWHSNKHFRGSWSSRSLKTERANVSASTLAEPVIDTRGVPVLLFAGEATSPHHYASVHGAVESGWREADRLISLIKKS